MARGELPSDLLVDGKRFIDMCMEDLHRCTDEGLAAGNTAVKDRAQGIEISTVVNVPLATRLLGSHKRRCTHGTPGIGQFGRI